MIGYDTLLGSHYDRYYIEYFNFKLDDISPSVFSIPTSIWFLTNWLDEDMLFHYYESTVLDLKCRDFPGPGAKNRISANPMREFIHKDDSHNLHSFQNFKNGHGKKYEANAEHQERMHIFRQNLR